MTTEIDAATTRLAQRYPQVPVDTVRTIIEDACTTVARMLGKYDTTTAVDLAQLRLDVRTRRVA